MLVSSASEDLLVSLFWNKWKVFFNHFSFENYWDSTRSKTVVPSTSKMIMIVWRPHITGSRSWSFKSLASMARVGRRGGLMYILIKICHLAWKIDTNHIFFLFLYFSRMNWIHKFQIRAFEGGHCWHECQADWRINTWIWKKYNLRVQLTVCLQILAPSSFPSLTELWSCKSAIKWW